MMEDLSIHGVIFDSDGTLVDSERTSLQVLVDLLSGLGHQVDHEWAVAHWSGRDLAEVFAEVEKKMNRSLPADFLDTFRTHQLERLEVEVTPVVGARELLSGLTKPFCVASNAPQNKVRLCLTASGLIEFVDQDRIFSAYDINAWKPKPDLFLHAAAQLGLEPQNCAVVEDSAVGVQAALAAQMKVFAYDPHGQIPVSLTEEERVTSIRALQELVPLLR